MGGRTVHIKIENIEIDVPAEALADPKRTIPLLVQNFAVQFCARLLEASARLVNGGEDGDDPGTSTTHG